MEDEIRKKKDMTKYWNYRKECYEIVDSWKCSNLVGDDDDDDDDAVAQFFTFIEQCISLVLSHGKCASTYMGLPKRKVDLQNEIDIWKRIQHLLLSERDKALIAFKQRSDIYDKAMEEILKIRDIENLVESYVFVRSESEKDAYDEVKDTILGKLSCIALEKELQLERYDDFINFVKRHHLESVLEKDKVIPEDVICWVLGRDPPPKEETPKENFKELMFKLMKLYEEKVLLHTISCDVKHLTNDLVYLIKRFDRHWPTENKREREDDESSTSEVKNWKGCGVLDEAQCSEEIAMRID